MKAQMKHAAKAVGAAVAGATVGYMAGMLTAPASGVETRRRIGQKVEEKAEDVTNRAKATLKRAKAKAAEALHQ